MREHPNENTGRMLTLIAKILQSLANLVQFEGKEAHMEACNSFIDSKITNMKAFLDQISVRKNFELRMAF